MAVDQPIPSKLKTPFQRHKWDKYFYPLFAVAACALVLISFGPTYYFRLFSSDGSFSTLVHVHSLVFSAWMLLFLAQTILVENGRIDLHVMLGSLGLLLALAIVVVGYLTLVAGAQTGYLGPGVERNIEVSRMFMIVPMRDLVWFIACLALAIYYRNSPETHKRLMLLVFVGGLMPVALARVPAGFSLLIGLLFMFAPPLYDAVSRRRLHPVYAFGMPLIIVSSLLLGPLARTALWRNFADLIIG